MLYKFSEKLSSLKKLRKEKNLREEIDSWKVLYKDCKCKQNCRVFWVNIAKSEVNLCYRNCSNLFGILRREIEFRYYRCRNSTKSIREKKKKVERENVKFRKRGYRISCVQFCCPSVRGVPEVKKKKKILTN